MSGRSIGSDHVMRALPRRLAEFAGQLLRAVALCLLVALPAACDSVEERAEQHYQNGLVLLAEGNPIKASLEFRNTIKLNDSHVGANLELGKLFQDNKDYAAAIFQYRKVIQLDGSRVQAHVRLGQLMLAFNQVENALTSSIAAAQLAPGDPDVLILEATVGLRLGNDEQAREKADQVLAANPDNGDAWIVLSALSRRGGDNETALGQVDEAIRRDPENVKARLFRLDLLASMGRNEELGAALADLVSKKPDEIAFQEALVRWQLVSGRYEEAENTLRVISDLAPDDTDRALDIVKFIGQTRGPEPALAELERLIATREGTAAQYPLEIAMAEIEMSKNDLAAASNRLRRLIDALGDAAEGNDARVRLGRILAVQDQPDRALALAEEVLARDANNAEALTLRGRVRIMREDYDAAIRDLRAAEGENPDALETLQLLALAHQRNGNPQLAGERLAAAVEASDQATDPVLQYADFLVRDGKIDFAIELVEEVSAKRPGEVRLLEALGRLKLQARDYKGAEEIAERLRATSRGERSGEQMLAAALSGQQRYDETISLLQSAREDGKADESYLAALVATHLRNDDRAAAEKLVEEALTLNPDNSEAIRIKGALAVVRGEGDAALALMREAVAKGPDRAANYVSLARLLLQAGQLPAAEQTLREGIGKTDDSGLRFMLAGLLERRGALEEAIAEYEILYERQSGSQVVANNLASLLTDSATDQARIDRAFVIAKRLRGTEVPHFLDTYGWVMHLKGEQAEALPALRAAAKALPDNPVVLYHLGAALAKAGETEEARTALTRAVEIGGQTMLPQMETARTLLAGLAAPGAPAEGTGATTQQ